MGDLGQQSSTRRDSPESLSDACWVVHRASIGSGVHGLTAAMDALERHRYARDTDPGVKVKSSKAKKRKRRKS